MTRTGSTDTKDDGRFRCWFRGRDSGSRYITPEFGRRIRFERVWNIFDDVFDGRDLDGRKFNRRDFDGRDLDGRDLDGREFERPQLDCRDVVG